METKVCNTCKQEKPINEFSKKGEGYQDKCKKCAREYYLKNKNKQKEKTQVTAYLDEIELEILDKKVKDLNTNRSDFIKKCIIEKSTQPILKIDFSGLEKVAYEINKIGVNINQIAYIANEENHIYKSDIEYLKEKQEHIEDILCDYYDVVLKLQKKANNN